MATTSPSCASISRTSRRNGSARSAAWSSEGAKIGILVTLTDPTTTMRREASAAGFYKTEYGSFEKIQILTVEDLFDGRRPHTPWVDPSVFKKAKRENTVTQGDLGL
jgi:site-specific DNA-methyltransferase (adenine-specific)